MDTRSRHRINSLLAVVLAGACALNDPGALARQGFRDVTRWVRVAAPSPAPAPTITSGVRG
jgi:hypothetical protein